MPEPNTLRIHEIFWSIQGEGLYAGSPAVFIRLSGCSLRCPECDSPAAWEGGESRTISSLVGEAAELARRHPHSRLVITGGEPLEQNLAPFLAEIRPLFPIIAVETNGLHFQDLPLDWWTVSPKETGGFRIHPRLIPNISEVKLIASRHLPLAVVERIRLLGDDFPIFFQPPYPLSDGFQLAWSKFNESAAAGIRNLRLGIQMHRLFDLP